MLSLGALESAGEGSLWIIITIMTHMIGAEL